MRAMTMPAYGGPATIVQSELPVPQPGPGQLLLRVLAHSVNPVDRKLASGAARPVLTATFPHVPGFDVCGVVDSRYPLDALQQAWERSMAGRAVGKIVVEVGAR